MSSSKKKSNFWTKPILTVNSTGKQINVLTLIFYVVLLSGIAVLGSFIGINSVKTMNW